MPLSLHHIPICVSFAFFKGALRPAPALRAAPAHEPGTRRAVAGDVDAVPVLESVLDPCLKEELACQGTLTLTLNQFRGAGAPTAHARRPRDGRR